MQITPGALAPPSGQATPPSPQARLGQNGVRLNSWKLELARGSETELNVSCSLGGGQER